MQRAEQVARIEFKTLAFKQDNDQVKVLFQNLFQFTIPHEDLSALGECTVEKHALVFKGIPQQKAEKKFNFILQNGFQNLYNTLTHKPTTYVHQHSGLPLIGTGYFGMIDRGSNIIEVRTITGCNVDCVYCSVDEHQRIRDFIVEKDYLIQEFRNVVAQKECDDIEAHINPQAEPFLYADLVDMIRDLAQIMEVKTISINTNGTFLNESMVDRLAEAGLTRINLSLNTLDPKMAQKMAGANINQDKVLKAIRYASTKIDVNIAPVYLKGYNEDHMEDLIRFAKELQANTTFKVRVGIQNYTEYKHSKKPAKEIAWDDFFSRLKTWEKEYDIDLSPDFGIHEAKALPKPFETGDIVKAQIICEGRFPSEKIAVAKNRSIIVKQCHKTGMVKLKIAKSKDNIFIATLA